MNKKNSNKKGEKMLIGFMSNTCLIVKIMSYIQLIDNLIWEAIRYLNFIIAELALSL